MDMELAIMLHTYREDLLSQQARVERLSTFGQLVGSIGHELRNPLAPLSNCLHILRLRDTDDAEGKRLRTIMERQLATLVRMTDDLLEAQRLAKQNGKIRFAGVSTHFNMDKILAYLAKLGQTDVVLTTYNFAMRSVDAAANTNPDAPKPAIVGNCQGGWAAMMLAAANPDDTGPIVINGAPMSYWGGAWSEGGGDNPMRYSGGLLGGTWLASLVSDLGDGKFDGAWLVQNFENLNPANTFWDKYYHVFANVDTEPPRFLEFERWWGGFYLMNREEIEWITQNLFVGNKLWSGTVKSGDGGVFDLREIKVPIILFASMGDNITPPQQAFNWVADVYGSTDEIKARMRAQATTAGPGGPPGVILPESGGTGGDPESPPFPPAARPVRPDVARANRLLVHPPLPPHAPPPPPEGGAPLHPPRGGRASGGPQARPHRKPAATPGIRIATGQEPACPISAASKCSKRWKRPSSLASSS